MEKNINYDITACQALLLSIEGVLVDEKSKKRYYPTAEESYDYIRTGKKNW